ncbi:MAG: C45 family autoproteolytic acyltransferase/hydrolase [Candidatus Cyclobacteriaceae bacterium M2_1C_046]
MHLHFNAISEPGKPGSKWQRLFKTHWEEYRGWFISKGASFPDLKTSQAALKKYMPEMWPNYKRFCKLANADEIAARFLTGFQPPPYLSGCSQAVLTGNNIKLIRNYDHHPDLTEGTQLLSAWNGKKVIVTSDCLIGAIDGMNEDGLAISLTFGGRSVVGMGFGIPFILRYILEFCSNVKEAVEALKRIPSHMSYNVTVVDRTGAFKTVLVAPDRSPVVTDLAFTTNHQGTIEWPENAAFNKTLERSAFLENILSRKEIDANAVADSFLQPPLYNTRFSEGFGTLYTLIYQPVKGTVQMRWPNEDLAQSFEGFQEHSKLINLDQQKPVQTLISPWDQASMDIFARIEQKANDRTVNQINWQVTETLIDAMAKAKPSVDKEQLKSLRHRMMSRGKLSWEVISDFWSYIGKGAPGK